MPLVLNFSNYGKSLEVENRLVPVSNATSISGGSIDVFSNTVDLWDESMLLEYIDCALLHSPSDSCPPLAAENVQISVGENALPWLVEALIVAIRFGDSITRLRAVYLIGLIGSERAISTLNALLRESLTSDMYYAVQAALKKNGYISNWPTQPMDPLEALA